MSAIIGFWKLVKYAHTLKICSETCRRLKAKNLKIEKKACFFGMALSMWIIARAIRLVSVISDAIGWKRFAVGTACTYKPQPMVVSSSSTRKPRSTITASWGARVDRNSSQVIFLSLALPPQADDTKVTLPFVLHHGCYVQCQWGQKVKWRTSTQQTRLAHIAPINLYVLYHCSLGVFARLWLRFALHWTYCRGNRDD